MNVLAAVFVLASGYILVANGLHHFCPFTCSCTQKSNKTDVSCTTVRDYWKRLPDIPKVSGALEIHYGNFGVLQSPSLCQNFTELRKLQLRSCGITAVSDDAFKCMPGLSTITIKDNPLTALSPIVLSHLSKLLTLNLDNNGFTVAVIPTICAVSSITKIDISRNNLTLTPGSLDCMEHLKHLGQLDLSGNVMEGSVKYILKPLRNIAVIVAGFCNIKTLKEDTFSGFHSRTINLRDNLITEIHKYTFANMTNLQYFYVRNNPIHGSHEWILALTNIKDLDLRKTSLSVIPALPHTLHKVDLSENRLENLMENSFSNSSELEELRLMRASIHNVEKKSFCNLSKLKKLYLTSNRLRGNMLPNLFWGLGNSQLETLLLDSNVLESLNIDTFRYFMPNNLKRLSLKNCDISVIESKTFENLNTLEFLILERNLMTHLRAGSFRGLENLKYLNLKFNRLSEFSGDVTGITSSPLTVLDLLGNSISKFKVHSLNGLMSLQILNLRNNQITSIRSDSSVNLSALIILNLQGNKIEYIDPGTFSSLTNLVDLKLAYNRLSFKVLDEDSLQNLVNLEKLDLSDSLIRNDISRLQRLLARTHNLKYLELRSCRITTLVPGVFSSLKNLEVLRLNINYISNVDPSAFKKNHALQEISLDMNRITVINWKSFANSPNLRKLSLVGNPLLCTCDSLWVVQAIKSQQIYIPNHNALQCKPPGVGDFRKLHLTLSECEESWALILKPVSIGLGTLLAVLGMYFLCHYRWHIRYTLFLARSGRHRYIEMQENVVHKYDAFVAYSIEDLPWVKEHLLPNVDSVYFGPEGFQLCLHHRDWLVGEDIIENIQKSIVESRRTIIVLSKAFAESYWCKLELAMAHMKLDAEGHGRHRLLVILLNDIPAHLLTARLRHILTTKTYITWPNEPALQQCFWKAIRKSLKKQLFYE